MRRALENKKIKKKNINKENYEYSHLNLGENKTHGSLSDNADYADYDDDADYDIMLIMIDADIMNDDAMNYWRCCWGELTLPVRA